MMRHYYIFCILFLLLWSCSNKKPLYKALKATPVLREVASHKDKYRVQIIYTKINRDENNKPTYTHYTFNVDSTLYFYPASTAKLFASVYAMQIIHKELKDSVTLMTPVKAFATGKCQTDEWNDSSSADYKASLANYIKRMLLVSDNLAYNRVFDFVGQDYFQQESRRLGFPQTAIIQRFDWRCSPEDNRFHNSFSFYRNDTSIILRSQAITTAVYINPLENITIGKGLYLNDSVIGKPKEFLYNNNIPLKYLNSLLERIMDNRDTSLKITMDDRKFLWEQLSKYPFESAYPCYDTSYYPLYKKYILYGSEKGVLPNPDLRIFNIVGQAYGFTTDAAYIVDFKNNIEFMLSATIYTNADEILNDDIYEYKTIAQPFMKALGEQLYKLELKDKRKSKQNHYPAFIYNALPYLKTSHW
jgi:hypothetical protein